MRNININKILNLIKQLHTFTMLYWHNYIIMYVENYLRVVFSLNIDRTTPKSHNSIIDILPFFTGDTFVNSLEQILLEFAPLFWAFSITYLIAYFVYIFIGRIPKQIFTFITILLLLIFALLVVDVKLMELMTFFAIVTREDYNFIQSVIFHVIKNYNIIIVALSFLATKYYNKKIKSKCLDSNKIFNLIKQLYVFTMTYWHSYIIMYVENYAKVVFSLNVDRSVQPSGYNSIIDILPLFIGDTFINSLEQILLEFAPLFWAFSITYLIVYFVYMIVGSTPKLIFNVTAILILLAFAILVVDVKLMELMTFFAIVTREDYNFLQSVIFHVIKNYNIVIVAFSFLATKYYNKKIKPKCLDSNEIFNVIKPLHLFIPLYSYFHQVYIYYYYYETVFSLDDDKLIDCYFRSVFSLDVDTDALSINNVFDNVSFYISKSFSASLELILLEYAPLFWAFSVTYLVVYFFYMLLGFTPKVAATSITIFILLALILIVSDDKLIETMTFFAIILSRKDYNFLESIIFHIIPSYDLIIGNFLLPIVVVSLLLNMTLIFFVHNLQKIIKWSLINFNLCFLLSLISILLSYNLEHTYKHQFNFYNLLGNFPITLSFGYDNITLMFVTLTCFLFSIAFLSSISNIKYNFKLYTFLLAWLELAILLCLLSTNLFFFYFFFEMSIIPMFLIIGIWGSKPRKIYALYQFIFYTLLGSVFLLLAILLIFREAGTLDIKDLNSFKFNENFQLLIWLLLFLGFSTKIPMIPFHVWLPEAHVEAPTSGSIILAGILLKLGSYGMLRFIIPLCPYANTFFLPLVYAWCLISIVYVSFIIMRQIDLKKIIAYSSIIHMNVIVAGLFSPTVEGLNGSIFLMVSHAIVSGGLFMLIGVVYDRYKTRNVIAYGGLTTFMPIFSTFFLFFTLSNMGFPGTSNFIGEFLVLVAIADDNLLFSFVIAAIANFATLYSIWLCNRVIFGSVNSQFLRQFSDVTEKEFVMVLVTAALVLILGFYPNIIFDFISYNTMYYINISTT